MKNFFDSVGANPWAMLVIGLILSVVVAILTAKYGHRLTHINQTMYRNNVMRRIIRTLRVVHAMRTGASSWVAVERVFSILLYGVSASIYFVCIVIALSRRPSIFSGSDENISWAVLAYLIPFTYMIYEMMVYVIRFYMEYATALDSRGAIQAIIDEVSGPKGAVLTEEQRVALLEYLTSYTYFEDDKEKVDLESARLKELSIKLCSRRLLFSRMQRP